MTSETKRTPSAYNIFMREEIGRLQKSHPDLDHKERFKMAAGNWSKKKAKNQSDDATEDEE